MTARGARIEAGVVVSMIMTKCLIPNDLQRKSHRTVCKTLDDKKMINVTGKDKIWWHWSSECKCSVCIKEKITNKLFLPFVWVFAFVCLANALLSFLQYYSFSWFLSVNFSGALSNPSPKHTNYTDMILFPYKETSVSKPSIPALTRCLEWVFLGVWLAW